MSSTEFRTLQQTAHTRQQKGGMPVRMKTVWVSCEKLGRAHAHKMATPGRRRREALDKERDPIAERPDD
jgi:hypothetical protein